MPKAYTYTAEFNPISFSDRIAPLKLYKEEYDKQQEAYYKLLEDSSSLADLENVPMDRDSYRTYLSFKNSLNKVGKDLDKYGMTPDVRSELLSLRQRQLQEINPLTEKQKQRGALVREQRKYLETHPNSFFDIDYSETPLTAISEKSTYRPYDISQIQKDIATSIYNGLISGSGQDVTDYDNIREAYGYDSLNNKQKNIIDNSINLAKRDAVSAYNQYQYANYLKQQQIAATASRRRGFRGDATANAEKNATQYVTAPDGSAIEIKKTKGGQTIIKGSDGKTRILQQVDVSNMSEQDAANAIAQSIYSTYYGENFAGTIKPNDGSNILVFTKGNSRYVKNKKGDLIKVNGNSQNDALSAYYGHDVNYLTNNPPVKISGANGFGRTELQKGDNIDGSSTIEISDVNNPKFNEYQYLLDAQFPQYKGKWNDIFDNNASIKLRKVMHKKDHVGWEITISKSKSSSIE